MTVLVHDEIRPVDEFDAAVATAATTIGIVFQVQVIWKKIELSVPETDTKPETTGVARAFTSISAGALFCGGVSQIGGVRTAGLISFSAAAAIVNYVTTSAVTIAIDIEHEAPSGASAVRQRRSMSQHPGRAPLVRVCERGVPR